MHLQWQKTSSITCVSKALPTSILSTVKCLLMILMNYSMFKEDCLGETMTRCNQLLRDINVPLWMKRCFQRGMHFQHLLSEVCTLTVLSCFITVIRLEVGCGTCQKDEKGSLVTKPVCRKLLMDDGGKDSEEFAKSTSA